MQILVTGGAGYIGSTLVQELLSIGHQVTVLDSLLWGNRGLDRAKGYSGFRFVKGDIRDAQLVQGLVADQEVIVHLAALVGNSLCESSQSEAAKVNVGGSQVIADSLKDNQRLIYASTGSVYGQAVGEACTEQTQPNPKGQYALTKLEAEKIFLKRPNTVVFRFATVFGVSPRQRLDLLVNQFVYEAVSKGALLVMGKDYPRSTVHIRDIAGAVKFAIDNNHIMQGQIFNVSSTEVVTKEQIAEHIRTQVGCELQFASQSSYHGCGDYFLSTQKLESLEIHTHDDLGNAVANTIAAVRTASGLYEKIYINTTFLGMGERSGNAETEKILLNLYLNYGVKKYESKIGALKETADFISKATGYQMPIKQPIVGRYSFTHESGIHTQGVLSNPSTYEPYPPELVGNTRNLSIGKQSGRNVIRFKIVQLTGLCPSEDNVSVAVDRVKAVYAGGRRRTLEDKEFLKLIST